MVSKQLIFLWTIIITEGKRVNLVLSFSLPLTIPSLLTTSTNFFRLRLFHCFYDLVHHCGPLLLQSSIIPINIHELSSMPASPTINPVCKRATTELSNDTATLHPRTVPVAFMHGLSSASSCETLEAPLALHYVLQHSHFPRPFCFFLRSLLAQLRHFHWAEN